MPRGQYSPQAIGPRTRRALAARGPRAVAGDYLRFAAGMATGLPWTLRGARGEFVHEGERLPYRYHRYKHSWLTERTVEVPIVQRIVDAEPGRVLEVGNVLAHYREQRHVVVDKYEQAPGVLNRDALELDDLGVFDLVVAISTVEHIGWDEEPRDVTKAPEAVRRLLDRVAPGGRLVLTVPVGYHPGLDAALQDGAFPVAAMTALRRGRLGPHWRQAPPRDVWGTPYDFLLYTARAVVIAVLERPGA